MLSPISTCDFVAGPIMANCFASQLCSRITVPTLMLSGRCDFFYPTASSQEPLFRWLGTPTEHKRRIIYEAAHDLIRESLDWLDRYLGPVR